jgi:biopolymer transport protein ExbB
VKTPAHSLVQALRFPFRRWPAIALLAAFAHPALARAADEAEAEVTLFQRLMGGGVFFMSALIAISVIMVWLVLDNWLRTAPAKLIPPGLIAGVRKDMARGDYEAAMNGLRKSDSPFGRIGVAGLGQAGLGPGPLADAVFEQTERERAARNARISYLSVIGVITPMIGLNGTVFGMIKAFSVLGSSGANDSVKLSAAIGRVLISTAGGLLIAIPAFAAYYILRNRISAGFRDIGEQIGALFRYLPYDRLQGRHLDANAFIPAPPKPAAVLAPAVKATG